MKHRLSLIVKLTLATAVTLVFFMWVLNYSNMKYFHDVVTEYATSSADQVSEIIKTSTLEAMLRNDKESLHEIFSRIGQSKNIIQLRLIGPRGVVAYSSIHSEVGTTLDKSSAICIICHATQTPRDSASTRQKSRTMTDRNGEKVMGYTTAIYNQPGCYTAACHFHHRGEKILGVLDIVVSLQAFNAKLHEYRLQFLIMTFMLLFIVGLIITFMMQRLVNRPVQALKQHAGRVASGNLDTLLPVVSNDEMGDLSEAINLMTVSLKKASEEQEEWGHSLEQKVEERTQEVKRIQSQLYQSEKLASLGTLVAGFAHEINNPLTGIVLYSSLVKNDKRLEGDLKKDLEKVISEGQRAAVIVKRLLEFSREALPAKQNAALHPLLDRIIGILDKQPRFQNIAIVRHYHHDLPYIQMDTNQIQQVFFNLFLNASKAMQECGVLKISTRLSDDAHYVITEVSDSGCGIGEKDLSNIFDPFFTTNPNGTGLGLSISYGIIQNHKGTLQVRSTLGKGTTFTVTLPVQSPEEEPGGIEDGSTA